MRVTKLCLAVAAVLCFAGGAQAGTGTAYFTVSANIAATCAVSVAGNISGLTNTNNTGSTTMNLTCTNTTPWTVGLVGVNNSDNTTFRMYDGDNYIAYTIAATSSDADVTGKPSQVGSTVPTRIVGTGTGVAQPVTLTVTARTTGADSLELAEPGDSYVDTVTATIYY